MRVRDPKLHQRAASPQAGTAVSAYCGAKTRKGSPCTKAAGWRTPHAGIGRCYLHGGLTPVKHGRYSTIKHERIRDLIAEQEADPDPLNVFPEIAALRALFVDFIERYAINTEALLAWYASWQVTKRPLPDEKVMAFEAIVDEWAINLAESGEDATDKQRADLEAAQEFIKLLRGEANDRPRQILDIADAHKILGELGRMVERVEKIRSANAISRPDLNRIMQEMWRSVDARVTDDAVKASIRDDWLRVVL